mgnify:CR=1 FL=1
MAHMGELVHVVWDVVCGSHEGTCTGSVGCGGILSGTCLCMACFACWQTRMYYEHMVVTVRRCVVCDKSLVLGVPISV